MKSCSTYSSPRVWTLTPVEAVLPSGLVHGRQMEPPKGEADAKAFAWDKEELPVSF